MLYTEYAFGWGERGSEVALRRTDNGSMAGYNGMLTM